VPGGSVGEIADFPTHPGQRKGGFQTVSDQMVQAGYAKDLAVYWNGGGAEHLVIVTGGLLNLSVLTMLGDC
jgi:hypothetical protein